MVTRDTNQKLNAAKALALATALALTDEQRDVATLLAGTHVVAAGPGSGKTHTLVARCRTLVAAGATPSRILVVTFTKAAAREFSARLAAHDLDHVEVRTWHSWGARLVLRHGGAKTVVSDSVRVMRGVFADQRAEERSPNGGPGFTPELMAERVALAKLAAQAPPAGPWPSDWPDEWLRAADAYQSRLDRDDGIDFADMLLRAWHMLATDPGLLRQVQSRYDHVMVDETQDNNTLQWRIARLLEPGVDSLVCVGDIRQAIYRFAGARPEELVEFAGAAQVHSIRRNWRSTRPIVDLCNRLMEHAPAGSVIGEPFVSDKPGPAPELVYKDGEDLAAAVRAQIESGVAPRDISVLYRVRRESVSASRALFRAGIPHIIRGGSTLFQLRHVRVLLNYARAVAQTCDTSEVLPHILHLPKRYLGREFSRLADQLSWDVPLVTRQAGRWRRRWEALLDDLDTLRGYEDPEELLDAVLELRSYGRNPVSLRQQLLGQVVGEGMEGTVEEDWEAVREVARGHSTVQGFLDEVDELLGIASRDPNQATDEEPDAVVLQTCHRSKGTEYEAVHVWGVEDGTLPHAYSLQEAEGLDEERRVLFVACSRAKVYLTVWGDPGGTFAAELGLACTAEPSADEEVARG